MCDQEILVGYLYGELPPAERSAFDGHLRTCADCRGEIDALKGTRTVLQEWTPPESHLGFEMVRRADPVVRPARARWWGLSPAWGLAAAAMLVGAVSAAIAQVELTVGAGGVTVRTGWATAAPNVERAPAGSNPEFERVSRPARGARAAGREVVGCGGAREHHLGAAQHARSQDGCRMPSSCAWCAR